MDDKRAETLDALSKFLEKQKALLKKTQADLDQLRTLRQCASVQPTQLLLGLESQRQSIVKLSDFQDGQLAAPTNIEWSLFNNCDSAALQTLTSSTLHSRRPSLYQSHKLSPLQRFVKDARRLLLDPIFTDFTQHCTADSRDEQSGDEEFEVKHSIPLCALKSRSRGPNGLFVEKDEDLTCVELDHSKNYPHPPPDVNINTETSHSSHSDTTVSPIDLKRSVRIRPPSLKARENNLEWPPRKKRRTNVDAKPAQDVKVMDQSSSENHATPHVKRGKDKKSKSETYNQTWTMEEQQILDRLLQEYPHGISNRWKMISRAMDGRRTPRQVASRVQKYLIKLQRNGIPVDEGPL